MSKLFLAICISKELITIFVLFKNLDKSDNLLKIQRHSFKEFKNVLLKKIFRLKERKLFFYSFILIMNIYFI